MFGMLPKCQPYSVVGFMKRCCGVQGQSPWSEGQGRETPPKAETLLIFGRAMEAANLPAF